jgi:dihydrofolate reductase
MTEQTKEQSFSTGDLNWILIAAIAENGIIGLNDSLPWRLSSDLQRFKRMTMGHCLLMGRKTYQSIGKPLPGRQTIILSRQGIEVDDPMVAVASSLQSVVDLVQSGRQVMVVGGADVYQSAMPCCKQMWITRVLTEAAGDTYFPPIDWTGWQLISSESTPAGPKDDWPTVFQQWQRTEPKP